MEIGVSALLDIIILALLAGTVFYAIRLSQQLAVFKDSKTELEQLVSNLSINIRRAHEAIQEMQEVASDSGNDLRDLIGKGQDLSHELQIITESGDNLADRLEQLASQAPPKIQSKTAPDTYYDIDDFSDDEYEDYRRERPRKQPSKKRPSPQSVEHFFIRDKEFEINDQDGDMNDLHDYEDEFQDLSSRAEKQLASALRRNRKFDA